MISTLSLLFRSPRPLVNSTLIAINALVFIYGLALSDVEMFRFTYQFGLIAEELSKGIEFTNHVLTVQGPVLVESSRAIALARSGAALGPDITSPISTWGTVFSSMFMHGGWMHIIGNMLFLYGFGDKVEQKLGHIKYLLFYLGAGIAAAWTQVATDLDSQTVLIGASGAIFGVLGAYLLAFPYERVTGLLFIFFIFPLFYSVGSVGPANPGAGIAYMAHVGGFGAGVLFMAGYKFLLKEPILPRRRWRRPGGSRQLQP